MRRIPPLAAPLYCHVAIPPHEPNDMPAVNPNGTCAVQKIVAYSTRIPLLYNCYVHTPIMQLPHPLAAHGALIPRVFNQSCP